MFVIDIKTLPSHASDAVALKSIPSENDFHLLLFLPDQSSLPLHDNICVDVTESSDTGDTGPVETPMVPPGLSKSSDVEDLATTPDPADPSPCDHPCRQGDVFIIAVRMDIGTDL